MTLHGMRAGQVLKPDNIVHFPEKGFVCAGKMLWYARLHVEQNRRLFDVFKL